MLIFNVDKRHYCPLIRRKTSQICPWLVPDADVWGVTDTGIKESPSVSIDIDGDSICLTTIIQDQLLD
jgi:hypothetical protein